jgi:hypothetical protein
LASWCGNGLEDGALSALRRRRDTGTGRRDFHAVYGQRAPWPDRSRGQILRLQFLRVDRRSEERTALMNMNRAFEIVLDLARQHAGETPEHRDAIDMVTRLLDEFEISQITCEGQVVVDNADDLKGSA